jgi:hypothetical protein
MPMLLAPTLDYGEFQPNVARSIHGRRDVPLAQLVVPDPAYRMPWHTGYEGDQPVVGEPPAPKAP